MKVERISNIIHLWTHLKCEPQIGQGLNGPPHSTVVVQVLPQMSSDGVVVRVVIGILVVVGIVVGVVVFGVVVGVVVGIVVVVVGIVVGVVMSPLLQSFPLQ